MNYQKLNQLVSGLNQQHNNVLSLDQRTNQAFDTFIFDVVNGTRLSPNPNHIKTWTTIEDVQFFIRIKSDGGGRKNKVDQSDVVEQLLKTLQISFNNIWVLSGHLSGKEGGKARSVNPLKLDSYQPFDSFKEHKSQKQIVPDHHISLFIWNSKPAFPTPETIWDWIVKHRGSSVEKVTSPGGNATYKDVRVNESKDYITSSTPSLQVSKKSLQTIWQNLLQNNLSKDHSKEEKIAPMWALGWETPDGHGIVRY